MSERPKWWTPPAAIPRVFRVRRPTIWGGESLLCHRGSALLAHALAAATIRNPTCPGAARDASRAATDSRFAARKASVRALELQSPRRPRRHLRGASRATGMVHTQATRPRCALSVADSGLPRTSTGMLRQALDRGRRVGLGVDSGTGLVATGGRFRSRSRRDDSALRATRSRSRAPSRNRVKTRVKFPARPFWGSHDVC